ncbi:chaperone surA [Candidatus Blochmanniella vafra str. BVAF]|uniref:Chaperone surA n=1 Tax=Blochmanniella vafra (strain BVAF) TaxID=859654 RepID=E8Q5N9_BLOVB|nr:peptidylprolyl isomerase [Candidatus Blochmannia vafer]ADV33536.1 chaperone surA [Candidatus Blochmannia vafer str. BVAF]
MKYFKFLFLVLLFLKINTTYSILQTTDKTVALVNNAIILHSDLLNKINIIKLNPFNSPDHLTKDKYLYKIALEQLITDHLITQVANKKNININYNQIDHIIDHITQSRNMTHTQFLSHLNKYGLNYTQYSSEIYQEILNKVICNHAICQHINISSYEINDIIQQSNFVDFKKKFKLMHIIIELPIYPSSQQINSYNNLSRLLIKKIESKTNAQDLIYTYYSNNIFPRITVKKTSWISWQNIPMIFDQSLQSAKPGDVIGPIHSYDGIHILAIQDILDKQHTFPIIRVKINSILFKHVSNEQYIKKQLLQLKTELENHRTTFDIVLKEKSKNFYSENYDHLEQWIDLDHFDLSVQKSLLALKKNQISDPIYIFNKWGIIKLIDIKKVNYSEIIRERAYLFLLSQKYNETLNNWIQKLKSESYIKILNKHDSIQR